ncbi:MAG: two-component system, cell cycle response regulator [Thermoanaerobacter sp.]|nr:two-component system, cell cycle response regulator [Thermoanaerobacter sp.]
MNSSYSTIDDIIKNISFFSNIFDGIRIIDPIKKKVYYTFLNNKEIIDEKGYCYNFWNQGRICINCISIRASIEDKTFVKIEFTGSKLYFITSTPFYTDVGKIVVEFLKDSTDAGLIEDIKNLTSKDIYDKVNKLNELVVKDSLTGLYNRRFVDERLPVDILSASLNNTPVSIIMADIDFFKEVNDTYGHLAGDEALKFFSSIIQSNIRKDDWAARYGGDEFMICLKKTDKNAACEIAERIGESIESSTIIYKDKKIKITSSFGVYTFEGNDKSYLDVIEKADQKLYEAKKKRNQVMA